MKENSLQVLNEIKDKAGCVFNWFSANYFKANPNKSHFLLTSNEQVNLNLDDLIIKTSKSEKLLGINIDYFLTFNEHVSKLCKKAICIRDYFCSFLNSFYLHIYSFFVHLFVY